MLGVGCWVLGVGCWVLGVGFDIWCIVLRLFCIDLAAKFFVQNKQLLEIQRMSDDPCSWFVDEAVEKGMFVCENGFSAL